MTVLGTDEAASKADESKKSAETASPAPASEKNENRRENVFSDSNIREDSKVKKEEITFDSRKEHGDMTLTAVEKMDFLDSVINNTRFCKDYSLFGGKLKFTIRSLTNDEVNAMSAWIAKKGTSDSPGLLAGRYRKYLVAAQVEMFNGTKMPPLEAPLFETLASDGKTLVPPGWANRCDFWDEKPVGVFNAIMNCIDDFDTRYAMLCQKADDANFWNPDTP